VPSSAYGTRLKNKNSKKIIRCTTPCNRVVLPIARVSAPIKNERYISVILRLLMPRLNGRLKTIAIIATAGMVSPILAKADPSAKFKLLCNLLALAALTAADPSGKSTSIAMEIPTTVFGAPAVLTPASIAGLSASASHTTTISEVDNRTVLKAVLRLLGLLACASTLTLFPSYFGR